MIDLVHDVANVYRQLIKATGYPGDIVSIDAYSKNNLMEVPFSNHTLLFAYLLLDSEVTFHIVGDQTSHAVNKIMRLTYAKEATIESADYIFILLSASDEDITQCLESAKVGTLIDPHTSATLIIEVNSVTHGNAYTLHGPGINREKNLQINFLDTWHTIRAKKNEEYPLGIDLYFIDLKGDLLALPRTTQVERWQA